MRLTRVRFTVRRLMIAVAVVAIGLQGIQTYRNYLFYKQASNASDALENMCNSMGLKREASHYAGIKMKYDAAPLALCRT
jgi:hypothetical protein